MFARITLFAIGCAGLAVGGCGAPTDDNARQDLGVEFALNASSPYTRPATAAREWMTLVMDRVQAESLNPAQASRVYAYTSVAAYEAVVPEMNRHVSLGGVLNEMPTMPRVAPGRLDVEVAQAAALGAIAAELFADRTASLPLFSALVDAQVAARREASVPAGVIADSLAFGANVGSLIIGWSRNDGFAATRDLPFTPPVGPGLWVPTGGAPPTLLPAEPYWGTLRPFALASAEACAPSAPVTYSEAPDSAFYAQPRAVYDTALALSDEQKAIALFWADDAGGTATPPGHWIAIITQLSASRSLADAVEAFAVTGVAMADAFISCWRAKFRYNLLRPETFIQMLIDPAFTPFLATPQFPEYTSGHSTSSGAASSVLTGLLGTLAFSDDTRAALGLPSRSFVSFEAAADEAALSRLYGGIHYPMGNQNGLVQGRCIGAAVLSRARTRK